MATKDEPTNPELPARTDEPRAGAKHSSTERHTQSLGSLSPEATEGGAPQQSRPSASETPSVLLAPDLMDDAAQEQLKPNVRDQVTTVRTAARGTRAVSPRGGATRARQTTVLIAIAIAALLGATLAISKGTAERRSTQTPAEASAATATAVQPLEGQEHAGLPSPATPTPIEGDVRDTEPKTEKPLQREAPPRTTASAPTGGKVSGNAVRGPPEPLPTSPATAAKPPFGVRLAPPDD